MTTPVPDSYPVERPEAGATDPRFNFGLTIDIRNVLIAHGYPDQFSGIDLYNLQAHLFAFIYGDGTTTATTAAGSPVADISEGASK